MRRWLVLALAAGCGVPEGAASDAGLPDPPPPEESCTADPDDCVLGPFHATCGDADGPPVLACADTGLCKWFWGGCARGWTASDCPVDDPCCHRTSDGDWPFDGWAPDAPYAVVNARFDLAAIGGRVVAPSAPFDLDVVADPSVVEPEWPWVECSAGARLGVCTSSPNGAALIERGDGWMVWWRPDFGEGLLLELARVDGTLRARVFRHELTDVTRREEPAFCPPFLAHPDRGTLRLSSDDLSAPGAVHGSLELELGAGESATLGF